jgi:type I restriction enzyme S subunit
MSPRKNWQTVKFNDVIEYITNGTTAKQQIEPTDYPISRIETISNGTINFDKVRYGVPTQSEIDKYLIKNGDILFSNINSDSHLGKTAIYKSDRNLIHGMNTLRIRVNQRINPDFLNYFCHHLRSSGAFIKIASHAVNQSSINQTKIKNLDVPLPQLSEQKKIVAKIEELFSEIDSADKGILDSSTLVKTYWQAAIDEIFSAVWLRASPIQLDDIADVKGGVTKGRKLIDQDVIEIPYLRVANVQDGYLDLKKIKNINGTKDDLVKYGLKHGDILFTEGGDKDKLGRGTIWRSEIEGCIHQNHIFRARVDLSKTDPEFVSFAAQTTRSRHYFFAKAKQTTNLASINMSQLKQLSIPNVDIEEQRSVVKKINETLSEVAGVRKALKSTTNYSELLKQSILSKAFKGELL